MIANQSSIAQAQIGSSTADPSVRQRKRALRKSMAAKLATLSSQDISSQSAQVTARVLASEFWARAHTISIYVSMATGEVVTDELCAQALKQGKRLYVPLFAAPAASAPSGLATPPAPAAVMALAGKKLTPYSAPSTPSTSEVPPPLPPSAPLPAAGKETFASDMRMLRVRSQAEFDAMKANRWGIREPPEFYTLDQADASVGQGPSRREDALEASTGGSGLDLILAPGVAFDVFCGRLGHGKGYYDRYIARATAFNASLGRGPPDVVALALQEQVLRGDAERVPGDDDDKPVTAIFTATECIEAP